MPIMLTATPDEAHLSVIGDSGSGKTHALRTWMRTVTAAVSDEEARFMIVDYRRGLLAAGPASPLAPLTPYLARAREVGFHMVAAHRTAGVARSLSGGNLLGKTIEVGAAGPLLSGDPREGALIGGLRTAPQPPGRGSLVRRGHPPPVIQVAIEPDEELVER
ncbi:hypothetical protein AB0J83_20910 [Actinoplanes sp. NPDC049596]|uniref:hypothetical protein n=1 Tax=unclassified Actinoplanes TaxID=2626549 RepID=UPI0034262CFD